MAARIPQSDSVSEGEAERVERKSERLRLHSGRGKKRLLLDQ
jgi:hypothetical protein